jgi:hypothetical protein
VLPITESFLALDTWSDHDGAYLFVCSCRPFRSDDIDSGRRRLFGLVALKGGAAVARRTESGLKEDDAGQPEEQNRAGLGQRHLYRDRRDAGESLRPRAVLRAVDVSGMPKSNALMIGDGLEGVERVASPWAFFDDIDLWIFPDVYEGELQEYLVKQGKRVWGCRMGAELEIDRPKSKEQSRKLGIDIGPYKVITGLDALRKHLKANDDQWVKISGTRGDMETFGARPIREGRARLDELEHNLGA